MSPSTRRCTNSVSYFDPEPLDPVIEPPGGFTRTNRIGTCTLDNTPGNVSLPAANSTDWVNSSLFDRSHRSSLMSREPEPDSPRPGMQIIEWNGPFSRAFQRCLNLLGALGVDLIDADPNHGFLAGRCGPSLGGLGVNIRIDFRTNLDRTSVIVKSTPRIRLLDWGAADGFLARFKDAWDRMPEPALMPTETPPVL